MLSQNCRLGLIYIKAQDEVYISAPSLLNYLEVLEIDLQEMGNDITANAMSTLRQGIDSITSELEEEIK